MSVSAGPLPSINNGNAYDIKSIPNEVKASVLKKKVVKNFGKLGCNILTKCIEASHRVSEKNSKDIFTFSSTMDCQQLFTLKKEFCKIKMAEFDLPGQIKLFKNENLCSYCKVLWSKSETTI